MRKFIITVGAASALALAVAGPASAYDYNGTTGFVGKGEVQSAFGMNNQKLQEAANIVKFSSTQSTTQALKQAVKESGVQSGTQTGTQSGSQSGSQAGSQSMSQDLTCTYTNGNGTKVFHRDGDRDGSRLGSRDVSRDVGRDVTRDVSRSGSRTGSRAGVINGSIAASIAGDPRKGINQFTGFNLGALTPGATTTQPAVMNAPAMNDDFTSSDEWSGNWSEGTYSPTGDGTYTFSTEYTFSEAVTWGAWDALPGENPDDCLRSQNADHITQISNVVTRGAVTDGAITDGEFTDGKITANAVVPTGIVYSGDVVDDGSVVNDGALVIGAYKLFATVSPGLHAGYQGALVAQVVT